MPATTQITQPIFQPIPLMVARPTAYYIEPRCRAIECTLKHTEHTCRNCLSYDSHHITKNCPFVPVKRW
jgi:hypothetical protein